jgi:hypothetical protein
LVIKLKPKGSNLNKVRLPVGIGGSTVILVGIVLMLVTLLAIIVLLFKTASNSRIVTPEVVNPTSELNDPIKLPSYVMKGIRLDEVTIVLALRTTFTTSVGIEKLYEKGL